MVRSLDAIVIIQLHGSQGRDEDLENFVHIHCLCVHGIEGMNPFDHQDPVGRQRIKLVPVPVSVPCLHIVHWCHHRLASNQCIQVLANELHVHGLDVIVVHIGALLPRLVLWLARQGKIVVINREWFGGIAIVLQIHAELGGKGGLARTGRPGDANHLHSLAGSRSLLDLRYNLGNLGLLPELAGQDEILSSSTHLRQVVQLADGAHLIAFAEVLVVRMRDQQRRLQLIVLCVRGHEARHLLATNQGESSCLQR
mmetsp:Transcript_25751/g.56379  ORF Transcript_25751/g.56379 Transcript_25751/m.56379 type:complete len:254 (-) Transcript_25751:439-1200(-)